MNEKLALDMSQRVAAVLDGAIQRLCSCAHCRYIFVARRVTGTRRQRFCSVACLRKVARYRPNVQERPANASTEAPGTQGFVRTTKLSLWRQPWLIAPQRARST